MHIFRKIIDFYIKASVHVALAVTSLVGIWSLEFTIFLSPYFYGLVFFATITGYNFVKYAKVAGLHHRSLTNNLQTIQVFSIVCLALFIYCVLNVHLHTIYGGIVLSSLTLFYAVPLFKNYNLRSLTGLKVLIVALVWGGVTAVLPVLESEMVFTPDVWITFLQNVLLVIALMIPFEIRDLQYDEAALVTMPQKWGVKKSKILGVALLLAVFALEAFKDVLSVSHILALFITLFITGLAIVLTRKKQSEYFAAFWVESIPIFYFLMYYLFRNLFL